MKRKPLPVSEPVIDPQIDKDLLDQAKRAIAADRILHVEKCSVCGSPCAPNSVEALCWVCRRLKISAWRDSDQQIVQE
jgi:hypothetical protein